MTILIPKRMTKMTILIPKRMKTMEAVIPKRMTKMTILIPKRMTTMENFIADRKTKLKRRWNIGEGWYRLRHGQFMPNETKCQSNSMDCKWIAWKRPRTTYVQVLINGF